VYSLENGLDPVEEEHHREEVEGNSEMKTVERKRHSAGGIEVRAVQKNGLDVVSIMSLVMEYGTRLTMVNVAMAHLDVM
jgi:ribosome-interacting GTPase 1